MPSHETPFFPAIGNVLHDGAIIAIHGVVPGEVRLDVEIDYLRKRFTDPGQAFQITLNGCTWLAFRSWNEDEAVITDVTRIAALELEILSAEMRAERFDIHCGGGTLEIIAADGSLTLDSGRPLTLPDLLDAATAYWQEFSRRGAN